MENNEPDTVTESKSDNIDKIVSELGAMAVSHSIEDVHRAVVRWAEKEPIVARVFNINAA